MIFNEELIKHALVYEDLFRRLRYNKNETGFSNVFSQMIDFTSRLTAKDQIDLLTLMYIGRFQDADMSLKPQLRFDEYRRLVESVIGEEDSGIIPPEDIPLEITVSLASGGDTNFEGNSRLMRGLVMVKLPVAENRIIPYINFKQRMT